MKPINRLLSTLALSALLLGPGLVSAQGPSPQASAAPCANAVPSLRCAKSPTPVFAPDGRLWLTWYGAGHIYVQSSDDQGASFSAPVAVNRTPELVDDQGEDRPQIALGPKGEIYLLWTRKLNKPYTGHIRFSRSLDGGKQFSAPINVNDDQAEIAHRFPTFKVNEDGTLFVAWIDKRDLEAAKAAGTPYEGAALYFSQSTDGGASFQPSRKLADHSCECCRIGMDLDAEGRPLLLYRHVFPGSIRDHALIRQQDNGQFRLPQRISDDEWKLEGCPHHGPALDSTGQVQHLAWFTAGANRKGLFYARADDQGISAPMPFGQPSAERPMVLAQDQKVFLVWKAFVDDRTQVYLRTSTDGGRSWNSQRPVASTAGASDHPLLVANPATPDHPVFLSWQTADEGYRLLPLSLSHASESASRVAQ